MEEVDESLLWLELLREAYPRIDASVQQSLIREAGELTAIFTASYETAKANLMRKNEEKKKARGWRSPRA